MRDCETAKQQENEIYPKCKCNAALKEDSCFCFGQAWPLSTSAADAFRTPVLLLPWKINQRF